MPIHPIGPFKPSSPLPYNILLTTVPLTLSPLTYSASLSELVYSVLKQRIAVRWFELDVGYFGSHTSASGVLGRACGRGGSRQSACLAFGSAKSHVLVITGKSYGRDSCCISI